MWIVSGALARDFSGGRSVPIRQSAKYLPNVKKLSALPLLTQRPSREKRPKKNPIPVGPIPHLHHAVWITDTGAVGG